MEVKLSTTNIEKESTTWNTEGQFELCADASNQCAPVTDDPVEIWTTITVAAPDAEILMATPNPLCPDEFSTVTLSGHKSSTNLSPMLVYEEDGLIVTEAGDVTLLR